MKFNSQEVSTKFWPERPTRGFG